MGSCTPIDRALIDRGSADAPDRSIATRSVHQRALGVWLTAPHRALARYLAGPTPKAYRPVMPRRAPLRSGIVRVIALGTLLGTVIGAVTGAAVGVWYVLIGALFGAPLGAAVGAAVGLPAAVTVAVVLAAHHRTGDIEAARHRIAATLAVLLEVLAVVEFVTLTFWALEVPQPDDVALIALAAAAVAVYGALDARLLRWATRVLANTWTRAWGWEAVR